MLVNKEQGREYLTKARAGQIKLGLEIDCDLDKHFRFKRNNFNIIAGHSNVGKTTWISYYFLCLAAKYGIKFCMYVAENEVEDIRWDLLELAEKCKLENLEESKFNTSFQWVNEHFHFIDHEGFYKKHDKSVSHKQLLKMFKASNLDCLVIDPWNSLHIDANGNQHAADYMAATDIRMHCKINNKCIFILAHGVTEALRKVHRSGHEYEGYTTPLMGADIEGGGKWINRVDDLIIVHRYTQHPTDWMFTDVHVRKIKRTRTGGKPTFLDSPVRFKFEEGQYFTVNGFNPLEKKNEPQQMQVLDNSTLNSKSWYEVDKEEEDLFNDDEDELMKMINI